jgi:hypothetical protein
MQQDPVSQALNGFFGALATGIGEAMAKLVVMLLSALVAAPAIASMLLLWAGLRWPSFGRSIVANCVAGVVVTGLVGGVVIGLLKLLTDHAVEVDAYYFAFPFAAAAIVIAALVLQIRERATFSRPRAAGIACAVLLPTLIILFGN